ncbi:hypothetical protein D043_5247B, partial [Vibrio parahaemolyticus EKP-021]|jgi:hypothetical protein
LRR